MSRSPNDGLVTDERARFAHPLAAQANVRRTMVLRKLGTVTGVRSTYHERK